jgi:hypothetical protein
VQEQAAQFHTEVVELPWREPVELLHVRAAERSCGENRHQNQVAPVGDVGRQVALDRVALRCDHAMTADDRR